MEIQKILEEKNWKFGNNSDIRKKFGKTMEIWKNFGNLEKIENLQKRKKSGKLEKKLEIWKKKMEI